MKTLLKVVGIIVVILLVLMLVIPFVFHKQIMDTAIKEANKQVKAEISFTDYSLSLFRSFPDFNLKIDELSIANTGNFKGDTLANVGSFEVSIGLFSVFSGDKYNVKKIEINDADVHLISNQDGMVNWDIAVESVENEPSQEQASETEDFVLSLKILQINNSRFIYQDEQAGIYLEMQDLNHSLSGDFSADFTKMSTQTNIKTFIMDYAGVRYVNRASLEMNADFDADLKNEIYTLKDNQLKINELGLEFIGSVSMLEEGYNLTMTFEAPGNEFKEFLSLVPVIYMKDFESIETKGTLSFNGSVKGVYTEEKLPEFNLNVMVKDAMLKYPDLPQAVNNIQIETSIRNPGGSADNTVVDVKRFHLEMADNPVDLKLMLKTPVSDPDFDARLNATIDLNNVRKFYPLTEGEELKGIIESNMNFSGKMSSLENEDYENFKALGSMYIEGFVYRSSDLPEAIEMKNVQMNFSPAYLDLVNLQIKAGRSDFQAKGKLENYLGYALKDDTIQGNFTASSNYLNLNDLMPEEGETTGETAASDTTDMQIFEVPGNINFAFDAEIKHLIFQQFDLKNIKTSIIVKDQEVKFDNLQANMFDGSIQLDGLYATKSGQKALTEMSMSIDNISISEAVASFSFMKHYAPILERAEGRISTSLNIGTFLEEDFMPFYPSMNGGGFLKASNVIVENSSTLNQLSEKLNVNKLNQMKMNKVDLSFDIEDGKFIVKPFDLKMGDISGKVSGYTAVDQSLDYAMDLNIPKGSFGEKANEQLSQLLSGANPGDFEMGNILDLAVKVKGTTMNPSLSFGLKGSQKNIGEQVKENIKEEVEKKKEEVKETAKNEAKKILDDAQKKADAIMAEARKQADKVRTEARNAAEKVRSEADEQAEKLIAEGKKKGMLAEAAAKKTAKKLREEANDKANKMVQEADKKADNIISKAQAEADQVKADARKKVDGD